MNAHWSCSVLLYILLAAVQVGPVAAGTTPAYVDLATFGAAAQGPSWQTVNDPVMGGQSFSSIDTSTGVAVWSGEVKMVPFLHSAGFCSMRTQGPHHFADASAFDVLALRVRALHSARYNVTGFQAQVTTSGGRVGARQGTYSADFAVPPERAGHWATVALPFEAFALSWRGQPMEGPPLPDQLPHITGLGVSAGQHPHLPGGFQLEVQWIRAARATWAAAPPPEDHDAEDQILHPQAAGVDVGPGSGAESAPPPPPDSSDSSSADSTRDVSTLRAAVILTRHGVRTPYGPTGGDLTPDVFMNYSHVWEQFPVDAESWGVPTVKGQLLTAHGAQAVTNMGAFYGSEARYSSILRGDAGVDCSKVFMYSDESTRDVQTAEAFLSGLAPHCSSSVHPTTTGHAVLFNAGSLKTPGCEGATEEQTKAFLGDPGPAENFPAFTSSHRETIAAIQDKIQCCPDATLCAAAGEGKLGRVAAGPARRLHADARAAEAAREEEGSTCTIDKIPSKYVGYIWEAITGPVSTAGYFASYFVLAALNNMTMPALADTPLSEVVDWYQTAVQTYAPVDTLWAARSFAADLVAQVVASLEQAASGEAVEGLLHGPGVKFVYLAGHDTNLLLVRSLLRLTWLNDGWQRNNPPPGGMLVFELHGGGGNSTEDSAVRVYFEVASPLQIQQLTEFEGGVEPSRSPVFVPGCPALDCPLPIFKKVATNALVTECIGNEALRHHFQALTTDDAEVRELEGLTERVEDLAATLDPTFLIGAVCAILLLAVMSGYYFRWKASSRDVIAYDEL